MSVFKIKRTVEAVKEGSGGGKYISDSGIYDITIKFASMQVNAHNARDINFNVEYEGNRTTLYGLKLDNNDGSQNYQAEIFNKLCIVADLEEVADPVTESHKVGKEGREQDFAVLPDFSDFDCKIRVQAEYSSWEGKIRKRLVIKNFYREDGATAQEILSETEVGKQIAADAEYATKPAYKDGLTAEDVDAWKAEQKAAKDGGKADAAAAPTPTPTAPAANLFAAK